MPLYCTAVVAEHALAQYRTRWRISRVLGDHRSRPQTHRPRWRTHGGQLFAFRRSRPETCVSTRFACSGNPDLLIARRSCDRQMHYRPSPFAWVVTVGRFVRSFFIRLGDYEVMTRIWTWRMCPENGASQRSHEWQ